MMQIDFFFVSGIMGANLADDDCFTASTDMKGSHIITQTSANTPAQPNAIQKDHYLASDTTPRAECNKIHTQIHTGEKSCLCKECDKNSTNPSSIKRHVHIHTDRTRCRTPECDKSSQKSSEVNN